MVAQIDRKGRSKWHRKVIKIEALGAQGRIFWDLDRLGQAWFFYVFAFGQKASQNYEKQLLSGIRAPELRFPHPLTIQVGHYTGRFWLDSTFSYLTTPDTGRCRRILAPTGFWRGSKESFFERKWIQNEKNEVLEGGLKKHDVLIGFFMPKWESWNGKFFWSHYTCCNLRDLGGQENWSKMEVQMPPKRHQSWSVWRPRCDLWDVDECKLAFFMFLGAGKRRAEQKPKSSDFRRSKIENGLKS